MTTVFYISDSFRPISSSFPQRKNTPATYYQIIKLTLKFTNTKFTSLLLLMADGNEMKIVEKERDGDSEVEEIAGKQVLPFSGNVTDSLS